MAEHAGQAAGRCPGPRALRAQLLLHLAQLVQGGGLRGRLDLHPRPGAVLLRPVRRGGHVRPRTSTGARPARIPPRVRARQRAVREGAAPLPHASASGRRRATSEGERATPGPRIAALCSSKDDAQVLLPQPLRPRTLIVFTRAGWRAGPRCLGPPYLTAVAISERHHARRPPFDWLAARGGPLNLGLRGVGPPDLEDRILTRPQSPSVLSKCFFPLRCLARCRPSASACSTTALCCSIGEYGHTRGLPAAR
jgi:hypothetical protein